MRGGPATSGSLLLESTNGLVGRRVGGGTALPSRSECQAFARAAKRSQVWVCLFWKGRQNEVTTGSQPPARLEARTWPLLPGPPNEASSGPALVAGRQTKAGLAASHRPDRQPATAQEEIGDFYVRKAVFMLSKKRRKHVSKSAAFYVGKTCIKIRRFFCDFFASTD